jgi:alkylhydroperoxidase family enzyme
VDPAQLPPDRRICLQIVDDLVETSTVSADTFAACADMFDDAEYVEVVVTTAFYMCVTNVLNALDVRLPPDPSVTVG